MRSRDGAARAGRAGLLHVCSFIRSSLSVRPSSSCLPSRGHRREQDAASGPENFRMSRRDRGRGAQAARGQAALGLAFPSDMLVMTDDDVIFQTFIEVERMM